MLADRTTETIAHFIGLFGLASEQARIRDIYEEFELRAKHIDLEGLEEVSPVIEHSFELVSSTVAPLSYAFDLDLPPIPLAYVLPFEPESPEPPLQTATVEIAGDAPSLPALEMPPVHIVSGPILPPQLPFPGSVLNIIDQQIHLSDNDVLGETDFAPRLPDGPPMAALAEELELVTDSLPELGEVPRLEEAEAMAEAMLAARAEAAPAEGEASSQTAPHAPAATVVAVSEAAETAAPQPAEVSAGPVETAQSAPDGALVHAEPHPSETAESAGSSEAETPPKEADTPDTPDTPDLATAEDASPAGVVQDGAPVENIAPVQTPSDLPPEPEDAQTQPATVERAVHYGEDAVGQFVNGARSEQAPDWTELLPAHHRTEEEDADLPGGLDPRDLPEEAGVNPDFEDGHSLVTGGNQAVNEAAVSVGWVDAPVIAAGGTWIELDQIEQVAAVSNTDIGTHLEEIEKTTVTQIAEISETAAPIVRQAQQLSDGATAPMWLYIDRIEGDLIVSHHLNQQIEVFDNDVFGVAISAASSAFVLGDNTLFNASHVLAIGLTYDQILIGGDLIEINAISQTLSLEDDDRVDGLPAPEPVPESPPETPPVPEVAPVADPAVSEVAPVAAAAQDASAAGPEAAPAGLAGTVDGTPITSEGPSGTAQAETEQISERQTSGATEGTAAPVSEPVSETPLVPQESAAPPEVGRAEVEAEAHVAQTAEALEAERAEAAATAGVEMQEHAETPTAEDIRAEAERQAEPQAQGPASRDDAEEAGAAPDAPDAEEPPDAPDPADPDGSDALAPGVAAPAETGAEAPLGNMLLNEARIAKTGLDTSAEITESLSDIVSGMDDDMEAVRDTLLHDPALAGLEYARVLMIEGDLIQSRIVEQQVALSDNDDISLPDTLPEDMEIVIGQNALMNMARIDDIGVDSQIKAAEGAYSDLLIHQASLIDEPVIDQPVIEDPMIEKDALVSEAIAFLAEEEFAAEQQAEDFAAEMGQIKTAMQLDDLSAAMT